MKETNRLEGLFENDKPKDAIQTALDERRKRRHRTILEVSWLDDDCKEIGTAELTVDQHGKYWLNRSRWLSPPEVVKLYGEAFRHDYACGDVRAMQEVFRITAELAMAHLKGGAL
jgi:hypothetical protein